MPDAYGEVAYLLTKPNGAQFELGDAADTATCWVESKDLDLGDPHVFKLLRAWELIMTPSQFTNLRLIIKTRNNLKEPFRVLDLPATNVDEIIKGRLRNCKYFRIRIQDNGVLVPWHLTEIRAYGAVAGRRL